MVAIWVWVLAHFLSLAVFSPSCPAANFTNVCWVLSTFWFISPIVAPIWSLISLELPTSPDNTSREFAISAVSIAT